MTDLVSERLKTFQYPFQWNLYGLKTTKSSFLETFRKKDEEATHPYRRFHFSLLLAFEYGSAGNWTLAQNELDKCLKYIESGEKILSTYKVGYKYVLTAMRAHVAKELGNNSEALEILDGANEFDQMSDDDQSAVWASKANILLEYGVKGCDLAMESAMRAVSLNKGEAEWHLMIGKLHYRKRHRLPGVPPAPSQIELQSVEAAYEVQPNSNTAVHLADCLVDFGKKNRLPAAYERASIYFQKALELNKDEESGVIIRCGRGFTRIPEKYGGDEKAKMLFLKAHKLTPNNAMLNHQLGLLYNRSGNIDEAIKYLTLSGKAGNLHAALLLLEILVQKKGIGANEVKERYREMEMEFLQAESKASLYAHATSYHFVVTQDFPSIVQNFSKTLHYSSESQYYSLQRHKNVSKENAPTLDLITGVESLINNAMKQGSIEGVSENECKALLDAIRKTQRSLKRLTSYQGCRKKKTFPQNPNIRRRSEGEMRSCSSHGVENGLKNLHL